MSVTAAQPSRTSPSRPLRSVPGTPPEDIHLIPSTPGPRRPQGTPAVGHVGHRRLTSAAPRSTPEDAHVGRGASTALDSMPLRQCLDHRRLLHSGRVPRRAAIHPRLAATDHRGAVSTTDGPGHPSAIGRTDGIGWWPPFSLAVQPAHSSALSYGPAANATTPSHAEATQDTRSPSPLGARSMTTSCDRPMTSTHRNDGRPHKPTPLIASRVGRARFRSRVLSRKGMCGFTGHGNRSGRRFRRGGPLGSPPVAPVG